MLLSLAIVQFLKGKIKKKKEPIEIQQNKKTLKGKTIRGC
jgi:hypothetical protein